MRRLIWGIAAAAFWGWHGTLWAQPALERLEKQLGQQAPQQPPAGEAEPGYLGVIADDREDNGQGIRVIDVLPDGPADAGGLKKNDLVTHVNGKRVQSMQDLGEVLLGSPVGRQLNFSVLRGEQSVAVRVTLGKRPPVDERLVREFGRIPEPPDQADPADAGRPKMGVVTQKVTADERARLRLPSTLGAQIIHTREDSPAEAAGLRTDDVIVAVGDTIINAPSNLADAVKTMPLGRAVTISYFRNGRFSRTQLTLPGDASTVRRRPTEELPLPSDVPPPAEPPRAEIPQGPALPAARQGDRVSELENTVRRLERRIAELEAVVRKLTDEQEN